MPTYQYACTECGDQLEAVQKFTDAPLTVCDACGGRLRKVFSPVGIVFKGSGFYRTDSRNGSGSSPAAAQDKPAGESSSAGEAGSADKPAADKPAETAGAPAKSSGAKSSGAKSSSGEKAA
ncbi:MAG: FmdB family transcriptional regulator [Actinobacteria bacterium]|nr:FmdB family transcriptional regulator [Actinomycetota bacterium]